MTKSKFYEILNGILLPVIDEATKKVGTDAKFEIGEKLRQVTYSSKLIIYDKYESMRKNFKKDFMKKPKTYIDRFKIAALIYIAFTESLRDSNFFSSKDNKAKYLFVHKVAFNVAIAIIESFIYTDEKKHGTAFCLYVKNYGIINKANKNVDIIIDRLIAIHKKNRTLEPYKLILSFADVFHSIECSSKARCEKIKK
ncbi:MAG: hypothetical protein LBH25_11080 [Fibromonadaceae bacterium]|jgi:hypothetical protein|nr:hypothetical protein [Fibromonadaceae bacterium]